MTKDDIYGLTKAETRLLEVLVNPESVGKSVKYICEQAKISRNTYYKVMKKEKFKHIVKDSVLESMRGNVASILNATYINALSPKGHQDRKLLLSMLGIYSEKQDVNAINNTVTVIHDDILSIEDVMKVMTTEQLKVLAGYDEDDDI
ncbi:phBC6A51 family helix-turn-helix protein [Peptostreptococcus equinus]|uniref:Homeodomain phBC6A51-type domain-containing protein n=1 Tax=Peptostreptococcus equinus TaxID=3003601 RepID=A0ABY7JM26_9FIRM|nr:hypothetical protein [Peptostreptococcus sp. CBA3647]WAW14409.1 hypothetical protein O0R46_07340 [Peptostreptococcus sp. CBA3647]